jgi:nucleotide-binding universal stress UspA family protein
MFEPKNILVPTDFSTASDLALATALQIAEGTQARIFLLHVVNPTVQVCVSDYCLDQSIADRVLSEGVVYSDAKLRETVTRLAGGTKARVIPDLRKGQPHEEILQEADERRIDLIVIASHGRTGMKKYLLGSVAEKVMREARCPVLLTRERDPREEAPRLRVQNP